MCYLVYEIDNPAIKRALLALRHSVSDGFEGDDLMLRCQAQRVERVKGLNAAIGNTVSTVKPYESFAHLRVFQDAKSVRDSE